MYDLQMFREYSRFTLEETEASPSTLWQLLLVIMLFVLGYDKVLLSPAKIHSDGLLTKHQPVCPTGSGLFLTDLAIRMFRT